MKVESPSRMKRRERLIIVKNALANIARGGAASLVALFLPPFLTRSISAEAFGAWSLILQLGAYVGYFDFGIQTAIGRFVAHSTEQGDLKQRTRIVSSAVAMLSVLAMLAALTMVVVVALLPHMFHQIPGNLLFETRVTLLLVGSSLVLGLPGSVFGSIFVGLQRNEIPAAVIGLSRLSGAVLIVFAVRLGGSLISMGAITAAANVSSFVVLFAMMRRLLPTMRLTISEANWFSVRQLLDYCASFSVWSVGMLFVTGLDLTIVGIYRFSDVGYYAVAATIVGLLNGLFGAVFSALGSPAAVLHARNDGIGLGEMVANSTRLATLALLGVGLLLIIGALPILRLWVGSTYAVHAALLLQILVAANMIRICISPYIVAMIGTGEQRQIILVPLLEGVVNLGASVLLARRFGAAGVALGTLIGSFVSLGGHLVYTIRRSQAIELEAMRYLRGSLLRPMLCAIPVIFCTLTLRFWANFAAPWLRISTVILAGLATIVLVWQIGLSSGERGRFRLLFSVRN